MSKAGNAADTARDTTTTDHDTTMTTARHTDDGPRFVSTDRRLATNPEFVGGAGENVRDPTAATEVTDDE